MAKTPAKKKFISDYRKFRRDLNLNQTEFWERIGCTQSAGSRYESGRTVPKCVAALAHIVYIQGSEFDVREFK